jgi:hypothetical protein
VNLDSVVKSFNDLILDLLISLRIFMARNMLYLWAREQNKPEGKKMKPVAVIYIWRNGQRELWCRLYHIGGVVDVMDLLTKWGLSPEMELTS